MKQFKYKKLFCLAAALLLVLGALSGCSASDAEEAVPPPAAEPAPVITPDSPAPVMVDIGGTEVEPSVTELDLSGGCEPEALLAAAPQLTEVTAIELGKTDLTAEQLAELRAAFPNAELTYTVELLGQELNQDTETLDLPGMDPAASAELAAVLPKLPQLESVNFVSEDGICAYTLETVSELDQLRAAAPDVYFRVSFDLFGQTVTSEDIEIRYVDAAIGNEGLGQFYQVMPYLTSCEYLLLDECGIDNETMAQFRDDFPEVKIVWRIWMGSRYTVLTDVKKILASSDSEPKMEFHQAEDLKYCQDVVYLDLGHNRIPDISFVESMPNLEVAVLAINYWTDATPLASCSKLEYLEIFSTFVTDLTPLASLSNLRHLNICNTRITDATPLYALTGLERLWVGCTTSLSNSSLAELREHLPNCEINTTTASPTAEGWRVHPRYDLLSEQFGYAEFDYCFWWDDEKFR